MTTTIIVFAKAPVPGEAKTRLIPALGAAGAARLHERLVRRTLATAVAARVGPVELCCAPDAEHPFLLGCAAEHDVRVTTQGGGNLGDRMHRALERCAPALLVGSDCPALACDVLTTAASVLDEGTDAVFVPARDGGYVLVGVRRADTRMFTGVAWGTVGVMAATRERIAVLGWHACELAPLWDVDRPEDLARVAAQPDLARELLGDEGSVR